MEATDTSTKDDIRDLLEKVSHCKISPIPYSPLILFGMQETDISRLLAFFLNAKEHHGAGTGFLEKFQDLIECDKSNIPHFSNPIVTTEKNLGKNQNDYGRAYILIEEGDYGIIVENKLLGAGDQDKQLNRYGEWLKKNYPKGYCLVYLSEHDVGEGSLPSESEHKDHYIKLRPSELAEKVFEPMVSVAVMNNNWDYACFTKLTTLYLRSLCMTEENKEIGKEIRNHYASAVMISEQIEFVRENTFNNLFQKISARLCKKYLVEKYRPWSRVGYSEFSVKINKNASWGIGIGFENKCKDFYYGISLYGTNQKDLIEKLRETAPNDKKWAFNDRWPWYVYDNPYKNVNIIDSQEYVEEMLSDGDTGHFINWIVKKKEGIMQKALDTLDIKNEVLKGQEN